MGVRILSATDVKNRFGFVLREIRRSGGPIVVERGGKPVAVLLSIEEYQRDHRLPAIGAESEPLPAGTFGMWQDRSDIDDEWLTIGRRQWESRWSDV